MVFIPVLSIDKSELKTVKEVCAYIFNHYLLIPDDTTDHFNTHKSFNKDVSQSADNNALKTKVRDSLNKLTIEVYPTASVDVSVTIEDNDGLATVVIYYQVKHFGETYEITRSMTDIGTI